MTENYIDRFLNDILPILRIAVIGDVMVDRYVFGRVERISPEAPVPVNKVDHISSVLGGAANVASNLAHLDCQVYLAGLVGDDDNAALLLRLLQEAHIDGTGLIARKGHATTTKMRILGARQQMVRLDFEESTAFSVPEEERLAAWLEQRIADGLDGIILSDYKKGVLTDTVSRQVIEAARRAGVPVLVDPKGSDWTKYNGADFVTPNIKELSDCAGYTIANEGSAVVAAARSLHEMYDFGHLMVTRSEKGITVIGRDGKVWNNPATAQEVFDVSGAGDTVAAAFLSAIAGHLSIRMGLQIANAAAGIVVAKVGTYPIHRSELLNLWNEWQPNRWTPYKALTWEETASKIREWQKKGETVVFTNGCFDILHRGHVLYLQQAAMLGQHLVVGLNGDDSVRRLKGETRPLVKQEDRAVLLSALACVDEVVVFSEDTPKELLEVLHPDILVKGGDYKADEVIGRESVKRVEIISFEEGYSTTGLVQKIADLVKKGQL
ncbi:ADP-heptose synthase [Megasphaera cerevisiae DSM 20462]|jgi:D-beta-D-heptose 7-phosphate kinase/D-beta-D-heptose 1-phosphate adenosyltransferase|uniref:Bifunctional protein HldE n=1 Tax=Megasphaera cerevisiae DSM 20462 TaxID=1122219 RepID=A0A0J6WVU6_9FIRM|nr:D-glycero-beta-D-manno-heptose-7-phosphate kinase [Megasphaera cerevisiae]KMO85932.1 ADP-heptose synthase [Megasphaera cerevisiae DSM 20462]MCI1750675.1 D-glycero-beta-D-manno-heptose-7-phosphate kinase [Megasphaera cerevisiae]OKY54457.1 bifunctional heptose 7-phosphate kinase/heptose 1-phosphate adenyltransferase [Megasphaera cerevisiae]SKA08305.1 D-beta-D-heptose 7-phosphate kinase / D-beta-D-heptose 1-phosphate adenosyltransferase [Megasphaera cerevisiae DSM 20462]